MPKHIIEFNLPEESEELDLTLKAPSFVYAIQDFYNDHIRAQLKYGNLSDNEVRVYEHIKEKLFECLNDRDVSDLL